MYADFTKRVLVAIASTYLFQSRMDKIPNLSSLTMTYSVFAFTDPNGTQELLCPAAY